MTEQERQERLIAGLKHRHGAVCPMQRPTWVYDPGVDERGHKIGYRVREAKDGPAECDCGLIGILADILAALSSCPTVEQRAQALCATCKDNLRDADGGDSEGCKQGISRPQNLVGKQWKVAVGFGCTFHTPGLAPTGE